MPNRFAVIALAAIILLAPATASAPPELPAKPAPPKANDAASAADEFAGLNWISKGAACEASSSHTDPNGRVLRPLPALLTGEGSLYGQGQGSGFAFHTSNEAKPHIIITLRRASAVQSLFIENVRTQDNHVLGRASGLTVWVSADKRAWKRVWTAQRVRRSWVITVKEPVEAKYVKIGITGRNYLHLAWVRIYGSSPGLPLVTRPDGADRILLIDGKVLLGTVKNERYAVTTRFGKIQIPASRVVGIVVGRDKPIRPRVVQTDGQVIGGAMADQTVQLELSVGSTLAVPVSSIRQLSYRISKDRPDSFPRSHPLVVLRNGDRLIWTECKQQLQLVTTYAEINLPLKGLRSIDPADKAGSPCRVRLHGGSTLRGTLRPEKLNLKLLTFPKLAIDMKDVHQFTWPGASTPNAGGTALLMRKGDRLIGEVADKGLTVRTKFGDVVVPPASISLMKFRPGEPVTVAATIWDGTELEGGLVAKTVAFTIGPAGPTVKVPPGMIESISRTEALPPPAVIKQVERYIGQLGADSHTVRETATKALIKMGKPIIPLLRKHRKSPDAEVRQRIETILGKLEAAQAEKAEPQPRRGRIILRAEMGNR